MTRFLLGFFSFGWLRGLDFLPPLLLRLLLAPMLWVSGSRKLGLFSSSDFTILNPLTWVDMSAYQSTVETFKASPLPFPELMAWIIPGVEIAGAVLLILGLAVRWISIPLLLLVGWTLVTTYLNAGTTPSFEQLLLTHGYQNPDTHPFLNILIYFIMFLTLFFMGAGRYFSLDWWMYSKLRGRINRKQEAQFAINGDPFAVNKTNP